MAIFLKSKMKSEEEVRELFIKEQERLNDIYRSMPRLGLNEEYRHWVITRVEAENRVKVLKDILEE